MKSLSLSLSFFFFLQETANKCKQITELENPNEIND